MRTRRPGDTFIVGKKQLSLGEAWAAAGIPALLRDVRDAGVKTAVLSNKPDNMTRFIAGALFPGLFDIVHGQRAVSYTHLRAHET